MPKWWQKEYWKIGMGHCMPKVRINSLNEDLKQNVMEEGRSWWSRLNEMNNLTETKEKGTYKLPEDANNAEWRKVKDG